MKITIEIKTDNAAFADNATELDDCLNSVMNRVVNDEREGTIRDSNGNTVGKFKVTGH